MIINYFKLAEPIVIDFFRKKVKEIVDQLLQIEFELFKLIEW